jgi:hypothetical protein
MHFLYVVHGKSAELNGVYLSSLDGKQNRRVLADVSSVTVAANAVLFIRDNTLLAQPFDAARGQPNGEVIPVAESVSANSLTFYAPVTASETGLLLYERRDSLAGGNFQLAWYDRGGKPLGLVGAPGIITVPAISPDEKFVAFRRTSGTQTTLWVRDLTRGVEQSFTNGPFISDLPIWSPNGNRIAFSANTNGRVFNLYERAAGGTGNDELLLATGEGEYMSQWSRDGRFIVFWRERSEEQVGCLGSADAGRGERKPIAFLHSEFNGVHPQLSPDSHWMAYTSDESGKREVYVRPFPGGEFERQISVAGDEQPRWRAMVKSWFLSLRMGRMPSPRKCRITS